MINQLIIFTIYQLIVHSIDCVKIVKNHNFTHFGGHFSSGSRLWHWSWNKCLIILLETRLKPLFDSQNSCPLVFFQPIDWLIVEVHLLSVSTQALYNSSRPYQVSVVCFLFLSTTKETLKVVVIILYMSSEILIWFVFVFLNLSVFHLFIRLLHFVNISMVTAACCCSEVKSVVILDFLDQAQNLYILIFL